MGKDYDIGRLSLLGNFTPLKADSGSESPDFFLLAEYFTKNLPNDT